MRFSPGPLLAHVMWPVALLPGSVLDCSKTLFPRWSLSVFLGIVYCRDHSWKTTVGANGSGLGPSIIQTLQCCCSRLGTLSQPAVLSQAPWELQYMPCFMPCDCYAGGLTTAFKHFEQTNKPHVQSRGNLWPRAAWCGPGWFPLQGASSKQRRHEQVHTSWHQDHSLALFYLAVEDYWTVLILGREKGKTNI